MIIDLGKIDGNKSYLSIGLYVLYSIAIQHGWISPLPDLELLLKGAIGAAIAHKISKINSVSE